MEKRENLLGAHISIAKGLHTALYIANSYKCRAVQLFTKSVNSWKKKFLTSDEINAFNRAREETGITAIAAHTSYLINAASPDGKKYHISCKSLEQEVVRCLELKIPWLIMHPGSHMGKGEKWGTERIASALNSVFSGISSSQIRILLETTAGQGEGIGYKFEHLAEIMSKVDYPDNIGTCLDTCHIFAAGYDIRNEKKYNQTIEQFDSLIGLKNLFFIHLNDSKRELGSRVDRHEHIGLGKIGTKTFRLLMQDDRLINIPKVIETPTDKGEKNWNKKNLRVLRNYITD